MDESLFTTMPAGALEPKFPRLVGDSWRPAVAGLLGAVPLAVTVAITGAAITGSAMTAASRHAVVVPAHQGVTVAAGALTSPKYPDDGGD